LCDSKHSPWRTRRRRRSRGPGEGRRQRGRPPGSGAGATTGHHRVHGDAARPRPRPPAPAAPGPPRCRPPRPLRQRVAAAPASPRLLGGRGRRRCSLQPRAAGALCPLRRRAAGRAVAAPRLVLRRRRRVRHSEGCFGGARGREDHVIGHATRSAKISSQKPVFGCFGHESMKKLFNKTHRPMGRCVFRSIVWLAVVEGMLSAVLLHSRRRSFGPTIRFDWYGGVCRFLLT
jgi:hypothetical protein